MHFCFFFQRPHATTGGNACDTCRQCRSGGGGSDGKEEAA